MKKVFLLLAMLASCLSGMAQYPPRQNTGYGDYSPNYYSPMRATYGPDLRLNYANVGYQRLTMRQKGFDNLISNLGLFANVGRTYLLNDESTVNFGIDATWLDVAYTNYKLEYRQGGTVDKETYHEAELSVQAGPALLLAPSDMFTAHIYVRYAPTFAVMHLQDNWHGNYASFFVAGATLSYGPVGIGGEFRYGFCDYKHMSGILDTKGLANRRIDLPDVSFIGFRAFLALRF